MVAFALKVQLVVHLMTAQQLPVAKVFVVHYTPNKLRKEKLDKSFARMGISSSVEYMAAWDKVGLAVHVL
jgi:hypothetical protein